MLKLQNNINKYKYNIYIDKSKYIKILSATHVLTWGSSSSIPEVNKLKTDLKKHGSCKTKNAELSYHKHIVFSRPDLALMNFNEHVMSTLD